MKARIGGYVKTWEGRGYQDGIPDEAPSVLESLNKVPSYRTICLAIMKNDTALLTLGFSREPCQAYTALKRIELKARGVIVEEPSTQLPLEAW